MTALSQKNWIPDAGSSGFGIANLPYGVARRKDGDAHPVVRLGNHAIDLAELSGAGLLDVPGLPADTFQHPTLNRFLGLGPDVWSRTRSRIVELLTADDPAVARVPQLLERSLMPLDAVETLMPVAIGDYVDFYASIDHASNLGRIFRPGASPLMPNWRHLPVGYHGRSSSIVISGTEIRRPWGQLSPVNKGDCPTFGPSRELDMEVEVAFVTGNGPSRGVPVAIDQAADYIFGFVLMNDWSARDLQRWEYQPLGPFLGKSFATSISPWVIPLDALGDYRLPGPTQAPTPLPYLRSADPWNLDLRLEVFLNPTSSDNGSQPVARVNARSLYWSFAQLLAHASSNGAEVRAGDLFATGTISGPGEDERGSLIELTWAGRNPITLPDGTTRTFLEDGDEVVIRAACDAQLSFGEVVGRVAPAWQSSSRTQ